MFSEHTSLNLCAYSLFKITTVFNLIPGPDNFLQLFFLAAVAAVHVGMQHLDQGFIGFAHLGFAPAVFGVQNFDGTPFSWG